MEADAILAPVREWCAQAAHRDIGLGAGVRVMTLRGAVAVERLVPGDRVVTRRGARRLLAVRTARLTDMRPCILGGDVPRPGWPAATLQVAPGQPILLRDWRARALFGQGSAMVPAALLADGLAIRRAGRARTMTVHRLDLGEDAVVLAVGLEFGVPRP
ncbi:Hint domain-containing protein [Oceaniglobus roseus]|uniref:Hint domain-containing protein n=1 Tax=Oceaniglobus roseus TaxID=1737570 RepID=UPI000C7ED19A|nr:Hint domain-containing protein [Kandeliimicrobium roseum]